MDGLEKVREHIGLLLEQIEGGRGDRLRRGQSRSLTDMESGEINALRSIRSFIEMVIEDKQRASR